MLHPHTELRHVNDVIGLGVFATRRIPRGTITWVRDPLDQLITAERFKALPEDLREIVDTYSYVDEHGNYILCWDHARFVNHSCEPTCLSAGYDFEIAVRDIEAGEQLTDDYGSLNMEVPFSCACGSQYCRKEILPDDLVRFADHWDALVRPAFRLLDTVEQPLYPHVIEKEQVAEALAGRTQIASCIRNLHVHPQAVFAAGQK